MELQKLKQELTDKALNEGSASGNGAVSRLSRNDLLYLFRGGRPPGGLQQAAIQQ